jgi:hypothetical protein
MRGIQAVVSLVMLVFVIYVISSYWAVMSAIAPERKPPEPPPLPLAQAAPEVAGLRADFRRLATEALQQVPLCVNHSAEEEPARPRGHALIWDVEKDDVSEAHGRLPAELRLKGADQPCTVYLITERERTYMMDYQYDVFHGGGAAGVKGFRTDLVVCAVDLPSQQPRGRYRINGNGPPMMAEFKQGVKEIDEDWAANLKRWLDVCVKGPEARYFGPPDQPMCRYADAAREVIDECEMLGSLPTLARLPHHAIIYNLQTDRWHPANGYSRARGGGSEKDQLMVFPLEDKVVIDAQRRKGRIDYCVALVAFPGAEPLGVYQVQGETWPLPSGGKSWAPDDPNARCPHRALGRWVEQLCMPSRTLPAGTIAVPPDATQLAGTDWLKGPGWLKRVRNESLPAEQKAWEKMAEECSAAVPDCRQLGAAVPTGKLPQRILVWMDYAECFFPHLAQQSLPKALQASTRDTELLMALVVGSDYVQEPKDAPKTERIDYDLALFTMPGAHPVGVYRVRGETLAYDRPRNGPGAKSADESKDISAWLKRFIESPQSVARESAIR